MTKEDKNILDVFFKEKGKERYGTAYELIGPLTKKYFNDYKILFLAGTVLYEDAKYEEAIVFLKKAIAMKPDHKLASLCFIHSNFDVKKVHTALNELRRFLHHESNNKDEHIELLREMNNNLKNFNSSEKDLIDSLTSVFL